MHWKGASLLDILLCKLHKRRHQSPATFHYMQNCSAALIYYGCLQCMHCTYLQPLKSHEPGKLFSICFFYQRTSGECYITICLYSMAPFHLLVYQSLEAAVARFCQGVSHTLTSTQNAHNIARSHLLFIMHGKWKMHVKYILTKRSTKRISCNWNANKFDILIKGTGQSN